VISLRRSFFCPVTVYLTEGAAGIGGQNQRRV
jgi:hypothetical protein